MVALPAPLLRELLAASALFASFSSLAEPHLAARIGYLLSAAGALAASRFFQFDALGDVLGWSYLGVSCLGAAGMFGAVENQTWRGDRSCTAMAVLWSVAPLSLLVMHPTGDIGIRNPDWVVWLLTVATAGLSAIGLVRLTAASPKNSCADHSRLVTAARVVLLAGMLILGWLSLEQLAEAAPRVVE
jgi:hypothetical protein